MFKISGIIIDYSASFKIYEEDDPQKIAIISTYRADGKVHFPYYDEDHYNSCKIASKIFGNRSPNFIEPCDACFHTADLISKQLTNGFMGNDRSSIYLAGIARANNFGILTGITVPSKFTSPSDCAKAAGVTHWDIGTFFGSCAQIQFC